MQITFFYFVLNLIIFDEIYAKNLRKKRDLEVDEDALLSPPELITKYGYPCNIHEVTTEDGYILALHRIPHGKKMRNKKKRIPVIVQHGLLGSSTDFILSGEKSLVYLLADANYDVWVPNSRGNKYSRKHTTLDPDTDSKFWRFSWHEIGVYDFPAIIDYILKKTKQQRLFHIGHSQGTTAFYVMAAEKPEYNDKIIAHFSYAPSAYERHMRSSVLTTLGKSSFLLTQFVHLVGVNEFIPGYESLSSFTPGICARDVGLQEVCSNVAFLLLGFNKKELNMTLLPTILGHYPAGAATDQLLHYGQAINSGRFCQFDHGVIENVIKYNSPIPPSYDTSRITAPLYFFYSDGDLITDSRDVETLSKEVANLREMIKLDDPEWSHIDYCIGISAKDKIYLKTIDFMKKIVA